MGLMGRMAAREEVRGALVRLLTIHTGDLESSSVGVGPLLQLKTTS